MNRSWLRLGELISLSLVIAGLIGLAIYMVHMNRLGEAFGTVISTIPLVVNAIRNIGQAQVMNAMAEYLAKSTPAKEDHDVP